MLYFLVLVIITFLSSCDTHNPHSFNNESECIHLGEETEIEVESLDLTTTLVEDSLLDIYDAWDALEIDAFEAKVVNPLDMVDK